MPCAHPPGAPADAAGGSRLRRDRKRRHSGGPEHRPQGVTAPGARLQGRSPAGKRRTGDQRAPPGAPERGSPPSAAWKGRRGCGGEVRGRCAVARAPPTSGTPERSGGMKPQRDGRGDARRGAPRGQRTWSARAGHAWAPSVRPPRAGSAVGPGMPDGAPSAQATAAVRSAPAAR